MSTQDWQEFCFHAACNQIVVSLIAAWFLPALLLAQMQDLFQNCWWRI
jgi:hypothetical protein